MFFLVEANTNTLELLLCGCISPNLFLAFFPRLFQLLLLRLHGWEEENLLDVVGVGEEHGEPVNAHTPAPSWGQTIFQSSAKVIIQEHCLIISACLKIHLSRLLA